MLSYLQAVEEEEPPGETLQFRMAIIGATGVGKTALINQFQTSECTNAFDFNSAGKKISKTENKFINNKKIFGISKLHLKNNVSYFEFY